MAKDSLYVQDADQKVPFLRGMVTHSLVERGLSFRQAYQAANLVRDRIRRQGTIGKKELRRVINQVLEEQYGRRYISKPRGAKLAPTVLVKGEDMVPFSKGILSQSLQASGLEPQVAYTIAQEIQLALLAKKRYQISRHELRRLIYTKILQDHDPAFADRYLLWRYFRSPDRPVIILFGGATGVGKTSVATEVAHRLGINKVISTDTIRQIMRMMLSHDLLPAIHMSSFEAFKETGAGSGRLEDVLATFHEQSIRVLVGVRAMLARAIQENYSLVVDGVHLVPGLMEFEALNEQAYVVPVVISTLNRAQHLRRFEVRQLESTNRSAQRYIDNFEGILAVQQYILDMAETHGAPIVENENLDETVASILTVITNSLREKLPIKSEELVSGTH